MQHHYEYVHEYLTWARAALAHASKGGVVRTYWNTEFKGFEFVREFQRALLSRIDHKADAQENWVPSESFPQAAASY